jgi:hypothetical protein
MTRRIKGTRTMRRTRSRMIRMIILESIKGNTDEKVEKD